MNQDCDVLVTTTQEKTPLKGILKTSKTRSSASRIICSPSSVGIRRTINTTLVRRSSNARRELRFDFPDEDKPKNNSIPSKLCKSPSPLREKNKLKRIFFSCIMGKTKSRNRRK